MRASPLVILGLGLCLAGGGATVAAGTAPAWRLVWSDEFNGPDGAAPDPLNWTYDLGGNGWGNHELETYTARPQNVSIQNGQLVITARQESFTGSDGIPRNYTSARLKTQGKASWAYGRIEARIQVPAGVGLWPAFWTLGANFPQVGWPACGEIDIMENIGREPYTVHGTAHGPGFASAGLGGASFLHTGRRFADDFHLFALEWTPGLLRWSVDNQVYFTLTTNGLPAGAKWVFTQPEFLVLNVAVGGDWPGPPNAFTQFPQTMRVDYVRVYAPSAAPLPLLQPKREANREVVLWSDSFPQARLLQALNLTGPWSAVAVDGTREGSAFVAPTTPGFYRLQIGP